MLFAPKRVPAVDSWAFPIVCCKFSLNFALTMFTTTSSLYGASFAPPPAPKPLPKDAYFEFMVARRDEASPRLLLVSTALPGHEVLVGAVKANVTVVAVDYDAWSVDDLIAALPKSGGFASVGLLDHGAPGEFRLLASLAGGAVDLADLAVDATLTGLLKTLGALVKPGGRLDLLACSVAVGANGAALLEELARLTGVTVAASTDATGAAAKGGDWTLELGAVDAAAAYFDGGRLDAWQHTAAPPRRCCVSSLGPPPGWRDLRICPEI